MKSFTRAMCLVSALLTVGCSSDDDVGVGVVASALGSNDLVISQVYGGGGNAGSFVRNDYVEIFNRGSSTVDLNGMSVQYAPGANNNWQVLKLATVPTPLPSGRFFLAQWGSGGANGVVLPVSADVSSATNMSASSAKVALVKNQVALSCGTAAARCSAVAAVIDYIGIGTAVDFEGTVYPALGNNDVAIRTGGGCTDTDNNAANFATSAWASGPTGIVVRHLGSPASPCGAGSDGGSDDGGGSSDGGSKADLATPRDLSAGQDLSVARDFSVSVDMAKSVDLSGVIEDLSVAPPDLSVPIFFPDLSVTQDLAVQPDLSVPTPDLTAPPDLTTIGTDGGTVSGGGLVVISQIYGGGGNTGANFSSDFVELFNRSTTNTVPIGGWSVQYGSSALNFSVKADIPAGSTIAPGRYFLVKLGGGGAGAVLPTPDLVGPSTINPSASAGKIALVNSTTLLTCGTLANRCTSSSMPSLMDLVGYGGATDFEGADAAAPSNNSTAMFRKNGGCIDSDNNASDFERLTTAPRNGVSPFNDCSLSADLSVVADLAVSVDLSSRMDLAGMDLTTTARDLSTVGPGPDLQETVSDDGGLEADMGKGRTTKGGCSCGVAGGPPDAGAPMLLLLAAMGLYVRRRRLR